MIKVLVYKQSNFPIKTLVIKNKLVEYLKASGISSDAWVSVALVGKSKMLSLSKKYLEEKPILHNVLTFSESEVSEKFILSKKPVIFLGEIVVCYPKAFEEAKYENKLIDEKVMDLITHGAEHLLGRHHE